MRSVENEVNNKESIQYHSLDFLNTYLLNTTRVLSLDLIFITSFFQYFSYISIFINEKSSIFTLSNSLLSYYFCMNSNMDTTQILQKNTKFLILLIFLKELQKL